jgi:tetratricopeptide (TPR) repeat protein
MKLQKILAIALVQVFILYYFQSGQASQKEFALHLYRSGEFQSAITELERIVFSQPDDPFAPYAQYLIALSHARTNQYRKGLEQLVRLIDGLEEGGGKADYEDLYCESYLQILNIHFREKNFGDFQLQLERMSVGCAVPDEKVFEYIQNMTAAMLIYNRSWDEALNYIESAGLIDQGVRSILKQKIEDIEEHRYKSPVLGGVFSLIPGMGHVYTGRMMDGVRSFFINAAVIGLMVFSFIIGVPLLGILFAIIEAVLYLTNVYGGINAAIQENARYTLSRRDEMLQYLQIPPFDAITIREELEFR